ncbi:hypothetical protein [Curtobacterium sp. 9128]|uniref:hypothetical protein n=1 Tax=Curtobacterium sp. 9128 TaxID=1793722 RepID=UPI0011A3E7A9|nr:hypothetical protein [Curtobacterium sp. 9128]
METSIEFAVHTADRSTAMELAATALRSAGHHVEAVPGTITASSGSRLWTVLLGALVHPSREYRRYEVVVSTAGGRSLLTLRSAGEGPAVAGGSIGAARRRQRWEHVTGLLERTLRSAGLLQGNAGRTRA